VGDRRTARKLQTRQRISDEATALFLARGFDAVTVDDVAAAADVSRMTVFNYFPRKEDLMLDRQDDLRMVPLREAIRTRPPGQSPVDALRALVETLRAGEHPFTRVDQVVVDWWRFVATSSSLQARLRELHDDAADGLAVELGGPDPDGGARLAAGLIALTVRTAREEAVRAFGAGATQADAADRFFAVLERGFDAVEHLIDRPES
jgi:AcrR family transcriptional regulator